VVASVIVDDLDVTRLSLFPGETDPPLVVDANAVLPDAVSLERLKPIARWHSKILQRPCLGEVKELASGYPFDIAKAGNEAVVVERQSVSA